MAERGAIASEREQEAQNARAIAAGRRVIGCEIEGLQALAEAIGAPFAEATRAVLGVRGRVILTGVGKSGHVARKIAATFASTGAPAHYVHPSEASHGDLGLINPEDLVIALSNSGETRELSDIIAYCARFDVALIGVTSRPKSMLGAAARILLATPPAAEACAETRAPTTSTTMQMALGDALAVAVLEARGFSASDFKRFHPGGSLGAALAKVGDVMHQREETPLVARDVAMSDALLEMSAKGFGCVGVIDREGALVGIVTDGDLRRHMGPGLLELPVDKVMTPGPRVVAPETLAGEALRGMTAAERRVTVMFVVEDRVPVGLVHLHDLLRIGVA
ncbi:MAG: KpsF/GutQ family sugar-phosphate isomerase [Pseudomonadota bacterium]